MRAKAPRGRISRLQLGIRMQECVIDWCLSTERALMETAVMLGRLADFLYAHRRRVIVIAVIGAVIAGVFGVVVSPST